MSVVYEFHGFRLYPQHRRLADRNGDPVPLAPRAFDALHTLIRQPGELVDKGALMKVIWPKVVVADNSLDQIISRLRRSLIERGAPQSFISTERGRGYRCSAEVKTVNVADAAVWPPARSERNAGITDEAQAKRLCAQALTLSARPSPDNLRAAFEVLQTALAIDPRCAPALAYRALLRTVFVAFDLPMQNALAAAEDEARRALGIDPALSYGHHCLANLCAARADWNQAAEHYEVAAGLEQEPHAGVSQIYQLRQAVGHLHLSLTQAKNVDRHAPSQPLGTIAAALASMLLGSDSEALCHADSACALGWPRTNPVLQDIYFQLAIRAHRFDEAAESMSSALGKAVQDAGGADGVRLLCAALEAAAHRDAAVGALRALVDRIRPDEIGLIDSRRVLLWLTLLGALDDAFEFAHASLDRFARSNMIGLMCARGILWMPEMRPFRADARFQHIVTRLRFVDYWQRHGAPDNHELRDGVLICSERPVSGPS